MIQLTRIRNGSSIREWNVARKYSGFGLSVCTWLGRQLSYHVVLRGKYDWKSRAFSVTSVWTGWNNHSSDVTIPDQQYTLHTRSCQLIDKFNHPMTALMVSWTRGAASRHMTASVSSSQEPTSSPVLRTVATTFGFCLAGRAIFPRWAGSFTGLPVSKAIADMLFFFTNRTTFLSTVSKHCSVDHSSRRLCVQSRQGQEAEQTVT